MLRAASILSSLALLAAVAVAAPAGADRPAPDAVASAKRAPSGTLLRLDGIGALRLGMTRNAAYATGTLRSHQETCVAGGTRPPLPVSYASDGPKASPGARYVAYFRGGRNGTMTHIMAYSGVATELGIRPGVSTGAQLVAKYKRAGYTIRTEWVANRSSTLIHVSRGRRVVLTGQLGARLSNKRAPLTLIAIPTFFSCR